MTNTDDLKGNLTMAFASPVIRFSLPDAAELNAKLIKEAADIREQAPEIVHSKNRYGWHSEKDLMVRKEPGLRELAGIIQKCIHAATRTVSPKFDVAKHRFVTEGWININPENGYNAPHKHSGFLWSGCYYVTVPAVEAGPSGCIEFLSPSSIPGEYRILDALCFNEKLTMRPLAGDMLLFPSYLSHWVFPNEAREERMTIAFNGTYLPQ